MTTRKMTTLALLTGVSLIIFIVELQIPNPFPIPGVKLGLANIITVYAVYHYRPQEVFMMVFSRIILAAIFGGNMMTLAFSLTGSLLCLLGMIFLRSFINETHLWISSIFGAVLHNIGQICVAVCIMGLGVLAYLPFLLLAGCMAGSFTGAVCCFISRRLKTVGTQV